MKILSIRIKNLASLAGEHVIDFNAQPLASAGLIAIIGKTGAGKSTILDAMCLALFNQMPRLKHSDGKLKDVDGSELASNSPLTVLRRGCAHGYAEVCFIAQDQQHYLARWEAKRARAKVDGKLQSVQRYLKRLSDGVVLADKAKAVDEQIAEITQLSFEQFTRAVLLAQSEVTIFLKARDKERGELLEYLTNSEIFAKIGALAYAKSDQIRVERKNLEQIIGHVELLTEDQFVAIKQQLDACEQQLQQLEQRKLQLDQQQLWYSDFARLSSQLEAQQQAYAQQQQQLEQLQPQQQQLQQLDQFASIRDTVLQCQQVQQQQAQLEPQLQQKQLQLQQIEQQFKQQQAAYQSIEQQLFARQQFEQQHQVVFTDIRRLIGQRDQIGEQYTLEKNQAKQLNDALSPLRLQSQQQQMMIDAQQQRIDSQCLSLNDSQHFAALDAGIEVYLQQLQRFIANYARIAQQLVDYPDAEQYLAQLSAQIQDYTRQYTTPQQLEQVISAQQQHHQVQQNKLKALQISQLELKQYLELEQERTTLQQTDAKLQQQLQQIGQEKTQIAQQVQQAKSDLQQLQQLLEQQRLLHTENVEQLRQHLQDGQPCPVCGSSQHPYRQDQQALSKALFALQQQQLQQAEQHEAQLALQLQQLQQQHSSLEASQQHTAQQQAALMAKSQYIKNALFTTWQQLGIELQLGLEQSQWATAFAQLQQGEQQHYEDSLRLQQDLQQRAKQWQHCLLQQQSLAQLLEQRVQLLAPMQVIVDCCPASLQQAWQQQPLLVAEQLSQQLTGRQAQLQELSSLQAQLDQQQQALQRSRDHRLRLETELQVCQNKLSTLQHKGQQNSAAATAHIVALDPSFSGKAHEWLAAHQQQLQQLQSQLNGLKPAFEHLSQQRQLTAQDYAGLAARQLQNQQATQDNQQQIDTWLASQQEFSNADLSRLAAIAPIAVQNMRAQVQQAEQRLTELGSALNIAKQQCQHHQTLQPELDRAQIQQALDTLLEQHKALQQQKDQHKVSIELQQLNLAKQQKFAQQMAQIQAQEHRWNKISSLIGDKHGSKFRDLAQQTHLDILLEYANQQLHLLSQRYSLKRLEQSLSLAIIDHDMGDEERSVASLSGGESFLAALALSLAIANMAAGSMKIESLFIDEGFGTLDAASLHMVMNALDQLQHQGRQVVVISHIAEMHERIPVQIQVQAIGSGASCIEIVG